jgi:hypothetical protein
LTEFERGFLENYYGKGVYFEMFVKPFSDVTDFKLMIEQKIWLGCRRRRPEFYQ